MNRFSQYFKWPYPIWPAFLCLLVCSQAHGTASCAINSAALTFGPYQTFSAQPTDGVGTVEISCTNLDATGSSGVSVALGIGSSASGTAAERRMSGNGSTLRYGIYSDAAHTQNWTQGNDGPQLPTGALQAHETRQLRFTLYGRIPPRQNATAGSYSDSLVLTVTP